MNKLKLLLVLAVCGGFVCCLALGSRASSDGATAPADPTASGTLAQSCPPFPTPNPNPPTPPAPVMSAMLPVVVDLGTSNVHGPRDAQWFFDNFSWQEFIALNWPAAIDPASGLPIRGVPNTSPGINMGSPGPRVWESWKADWELFRPIDPSTGQMGVPTDWTSYALNPSSDPCPNINPPAGSRIFTQGTKMDSLLPDFNQAFSSPLFAQNQLPARYDIHFNQTGYSMIQQNDWYAQLPSQVKFQTSPWFGEIPQGAPYGIIELKAAWRELKATDDDSRYYWVTATVLDPGSPQTCRPAKMALVGFHIGHKTSLKANGQIIGAMTEWVWSTFEHIDNVPDGTPGQLKTYPFNNGQGTPPTNCPSPNQALNCGYDYKPPKQKANQPFPANPKPVQVTRVTPISDTTAALNQQFRQFLKSQLGENTVWQYYQLVATQWPTIVKGQNFNPAGTYPFNCDCPFPNDHVANTTAETYFQQTDYGTGMGNSCMSCHFQAGTTDFSWTLALKSGQTSSLNAMLKAFKSSNRKLRVRVTPGDLLRQKAIEHLGRQ